MAVLGNNYTTTNPPKTSDGRVAFGTGNYQVFNSNSTFTVPCGVTKAKVHVYGAGGGGGLVGGGGAGGGYGSCVLTVTPGCVCNITVGTGGAPGTTSSFIGANGSLTCFGAVIGCGGQGGCSFICNTACAVVPAANGGGAVGTTAFKGGNGSICVDSGGGGSGSPLGAGGAGGAVIQGGGGGAVYPGCIGGGGTGGPGGTSLGGADLSGVQRLSSGNLYDKDVIGRFPGDIISGGGGGCLTGTGGIGGGAGGLGANAGICSGMVGGYFGGGSGGIRCGGNGGVSGGGGGAGYGAYGVVSFAHGTGLLYKGFTVPSVFQSVGGANTVGIGSPNTSLCIMGAGCNCVTANNLGMWTSCSTDGNYYYCNSFCHTVTSALTDQYMKQITGINTAECIIQNGDALCYIYLDAGLMCTASGNVACPQCIFTGLPTLKMQIVCLTSNSSNPVSGANICGTSTAPFCAIHCFIDNSVTSFQNCCMGFNNAIINWAYIPCSCQILVTDSTCTVVCSLTGSMCYRLYNISSAGATLVPGTAASTIAATQIVNMETCNTYNLGIGCNNSCVTLACSGALTTASNFSCITTSCNSTIPCMGHKFRCMLYVPNCATVNSFVYTGWACHACHFGIANFGHRGSYIISTTDTTRICRPFGIDNFNIACSTILVNAKCQIGCIPDACPDVYYMSADTACFHNQAYGCKLYGLTTDPTCWCYNQATCWSCNNIHPATLTYWPQANLFIAFSSNNDTYAYSNTLQGNWTFATHCAVKCAGAQYWAHCGLSCSTLHPQRTCSTPPIAVANNRIAIKHYNCASGACCTGILVSNNIACSACWVNITCASQAGWCGAWCNIHYVPYLDRIVALHGCCIHVSSLSNEAVSFTSCNLSTIAASCWCSFGTGWTGTAFLYNEYPNVTQTCRLFNDDCQPGMNLAISQAVIGSCCPIQRSYICYGANNVAVIGFNDSCCAIGIAMSCNGTTWATYIGCINCFPSITDCFTCRITCNLQVVGSANNTIITGKNCGTYNYVHFDGTSLCAVRSNCSLANMSCFNLMHHNGNFLAFSRRVICDGVCVSGYWTTTPRTCTWTCPSFFSTSPGCLAGHKNILCTLNCSNQTCFTFLHTGCCTSNAIISRSANMCTWSSAVGVLRTYGTYQNCEPVHINNYHYDPCYDLFFWAYAPSSMVAFNNDMTSVCCTAQRNVFMLNNNGSFSCSLSVCQASMIDAQNGARFLGCFGVNADFNSTRCVYNICGSFGVGGMTYGATSVNMIPKCDFTNAANPIYCFCNAPGPLLVVGYCTTTKCFTMCNYPAGWTDITYSGTYCGTTNYVGQSGCGGNGLAIVEY
jgi:hypothetical protein